MEKRYWMIRVLYGFVEQFATKVSIGQFTERQIEHLLKALAAWKGLQGDEIVGAYAKRGTKIANDLLVVRKDFPTWMCGDNPTATATVVDEAGSPIQRPRLKS